MSPDVTHQYEDLHCWRHIFRCQLRTRVDQRVPSYYHQNFRFQCVFYHLFIDEFELTTFTANARAQLLTVPPYAVCAVVLCLTSYTSDRLQSRGLCVALSASLGGIGYLLLLTVTENNHVRYFATFCITSGTYTVIGVIIAWCKFAVRLSRIIWLTIFLVAHNLGSETKKATGIPLYMAIGQCGSVLGSHIFPATEGPRYM